MFEHIHGLSQARRWATLRLVAARFVWPGLAADVVAWCKECAACNRAKVTRQPTTTAEKMAIPAARFSHVHVDIVGPLPPSRENYTLLLTMIDRSSRWPEAVLMRETTTEAVLDAFLATWVARFGVPFVITTDRGVQFTSATWDSWCGDYGVQYITTTAFNPQSNVMVERLQRQMKDALGARGSAAAWADHLPWVMLGIRASPKEESGMLVGEAALGNVLAVPGQLLPTTAPPVDTTSPPAVIPVAKRTYAEAAATPAL